MKNLMKMSAVAALVIFANQSSFAQSCVEDVECQQNKIEAMADSHMGDVMADIESLGNFLSKKITNAQDAGEYVPSAKTFIRIDELEVEARSLTRSSNSSGLSIRGRTLSEIKEEVSLIKASIMAEGAQ